MTKFTVTSVAKDSPGAGQVTIVGTYADVDVSLVGAQQYTIPNYTDQNPNWSRINRHTGTDFVVRRNGVTQAVAIEADGINRIAYTLENNLTFAPAVLVQPSNQEVTVGGDAVFTCEFGSELGVTYRWRESVDQSLWSGFTDGPAAGIVYAGGQTPTLTLTPTDMTKNGYYYKCEATNAIGVTSTMIAQLLIN